MLLTASTKTWQLRLGIAPQEEIGAFLFINKGLTRLAFFINILKCLYLMRQRYRIINFRRRGRYV